VKNIHNGRVCNGKTDGSKANADYYLYGYLGFGISVGITETDARGSCLYGDFRDEIPVRRE
jgi:hypothetical protein